MSKRMKFDSNDPKTSAKATSNDAPVDMHGEDQNPKETPNVAKPPPLFQGDIVCFHEIFEWLSIDDIHSVGQTCKRLQVIAGDFVKCYLPAAQLTCNRRGFVSSYSNQPLDGFSSYVQKIGVYGASERSLDLSFHHIASIKNAKLKTIDLRHAEVTSERAMNIKEILKNIETVILKSAKCELYGCFLQFCPNLKQITIFSGLKTRTKHLIGTNNQWLTRKYPKLEFFGLKLNKNFKMPQPELKIFFELNSQIKILKMYHMELWYHKESLLNTKIQLDILAIWINPPTHYESNKEYNEAFALLHQLYNQGFYKRLHVCTLDELDERITVLPGLEILKALTYIAPSRRASAFLNSISLINLKELNLSYYCRRSVCSLLAKKVPNLKRLCLRYMCGKKSDIILPFLQQCALLNKVKLILFQTPNLATWNKERSKLAGAKKVTIFVDEDIFLATKWSNESIDLEFIEIRRTDSYEWVQHLFS